MGISVLTKETARELWPEKTKWLEENDIEYKAYNEWIPSTGENGDWIFIPNEDDAMAFKIMFGDL